MAAGLAEKHKALVNLNWEKQITPRNERSMSNFALVLPRDFSDYEWEVTAKGWFSEGQLSFSGKHYRLNFYDRGRLNQQIESELQGGNVFFEPNLLVINSVTRAEMERATEFLVQSGLTRFLIAEKE